MNSLKQQCLNRVSFERFIPVISVAFGICLLLSSGCSSIISAQTEKFANQLSTAMLNNDDPSTVAESLPTFLVLLDSFVQDEADYRPLLAAARLYGAYAGNFIEDDLDRQKRLSFRSWSYVKRAACQYEENWCDLHQKDLQEIMSLSGDWEKDDVFILYTYATNWVGYIQSHSDDWNLVADLPKAKFILTKMVELDENYDFGGAHLYLGGIATLLPPSLGGKPEVGKAHFERAIELSDGKNLIAKVEYARRYARLVFDQELHHRLLTEVLQSEIHYPGLTLINALAHQQAERLLADEADYF